MDRQEEIQKVYQLGEAIGYGNLMEIASALWEESLVNSGVSNEGVFVPMPRSFMKKKYEDLLELRPYRIQEVFKVLDRSLDHHLKRVEVSGFVAYECSCGYRTNAAELNGFSHQSFTEEDALKEAKIHLKENEVKK